MLWTHPKKPLAGRRRRPTSTNFNIREQCGVSDPLLSVFFLFSSLLRRWRHLDGFFRSGTHSGAEKRERELTMKVVHDGSGIFPIAFVAQRYFPNFLCYMK